MRVHGLLDPGEPLPLPSKAAIAGRSRAVTVAMEALPVPGQERPRWVVPGMAALGIAVLAVGLYFRAPEPEPTLAVAATPRPLAKPARASIFAGSKPSIAQENWSYGRVGAPPRHGVPSQAALAAFRNDMEKLAEKQKQAHGALP